MATLYPQERQLQLIQAAINNGVDKQALLTQFKTWDDAKKNRWFTITEERLAQKSAAPEGRAAGPQQSEMQFTPDTAAPEAGPSMLQELNDSAYQTITKPLADTARQVGESVESVAVGMGRGLAGGGYNLAQQKSLELQGATSEEARSATDKQIEEASSGVRKLPYLAGWVTGMAVGGKGFMELSKAFGKATKIASMNSALAQAGTFLAGESAIGAATGAAYGAAEAAATGGDKSDAANTGAVLGGVLGPTAQLLPGALKLSKGFIKGVREHAINQFTPSVRSIFEDMGRYAAAAADPKGAQHAMVKRVAGYVNGVRQAKEEAQVALQKGLNVDLSAANEEFVAVTKNLQGQLDAVVDGTLAKAGQAAGEADKALQAHTLQLVHTLEESDQHFRVWYQNKVEPILAANKETSITLDGGKLQSGLLDSGWFLQNNKGELRVNDEMIKSIEGEAVRDVGRAVLKDLVQPLEALMPSGIDKRSSQVKIPFGLALKLKQLLSGGVNAQIMKAEARDTTIHLKDLIKSQLHEVDKMNGVEGASLKVIDEMYGNAKDATSKLRTSLTGDKADSKLATLFSEMITGDETLRVSKMEAFKKSTLGLYQREMDEGIRLATESARKNRLGPERLVPLRKKLLGKLEQGLDLENPEEVKQFAEEFGLMADVSQADELLRSLRERGKPVSENISRLLDRAFSYGRESDAAMTQLEHIVEKYANTESVRGRLAQFKKTRLELRRGVESGAYQKGSARNVIRDLSRGLGPDESKVIQFLWNEHPILKRSLEKTMYLAKVNESKGVVNDMGVSQGILFAIGSLAGGTTARTVGVSQGVGALTGGALGFSLGWMMKHPSSLALYIYKTNKKAGFQWALEKATKLSNAYEVGMRALAANQSAIQE